MWLDRVSNPGHLALESDVQQTMLCGPARSIRESDAYQPTCDKSRKLSY